MLRWSEVNRQTVPELLLLPVLCPVLCRLSPDWKEVVVLLLQPEKKKQRKKKRK